jgi:fumarate hydratase class II
MATLTHATRAANPAARNLLSVAARSPAVTRALSSSRQISQFPRIQTLSNSKRAFSTSVTMSSASRTESDAFGEIQVPGDKYWGAQTQR